MFIHQKWLLNLLLLVLLTWAVPAGATSLSVLTYNVAGLPNLSGGGGEAPNLAKNLAISPMLDAALYDVVAIQEAFDSTIYASHANNNTGFPATNTPSQEAPVAPALVPSGLMRLSNSALAGYERNPWTTCENTDQFDCLANKGFSFARHDLGGGAEVDIYNWHAEAGNTANDVIARNAQISQMLDYIEGNSADRAVILLGDTNSRYTRTSDEIRDILSVGFQDAWLDKYFAGIAPVQTDISNTSDCDTSPDSASCELKDKIFFRSGGTTMLTLNGYAIPDNFVDDFGAPLSDHLPVLASFEITAIPEPATVTQLMLGLAILGIRRRGARS